MGIRESCRPANVTVGAIITATTAMLARNRVFVIGFVLVLSGLTTFADTLMTLPDQPLRWTDGAIQVLLWVASVIALYRLMSAMLRTADVQDREMPRRYVAYVLQSFIMTIAIGVGLVLLIVPGLILAARWSIAAPLLVGKGRTIPNSLVQSWHETRAHVVSIIVAGTAIFSVPIIFAVGAGFLIETDELLASIVFNLIVSCINVLSTAVMAALMLLIRPPEESMTDVFA